MAFKPDNPRPLSGGRYLSPQLMAKGDTMLNVFFADKLKGSQTFFIAAQEHMQRILPEEARNLDVRLDLPEVWAKAQVNKSVIKNLPSERTYREIGKMKMGTGAYFSAAGVANDSGNAANCLTCSLEGLSEAHTAGDVPSEPRDLDAGQAGTPTGKRTSRFGLGSGAQPPGLCLNARDCGLVEENLPDLLPCHRADQ